MSQDDYQRLFDLMEEAARHTPMKAPAVHIEWPVSPSQARDPEYMQMLTGGKKQDLERRPGNRRPRKISMKR